MDDDENLGVGRSRYVFGGEESSASYGGLATQNACLNIL